MQYAKWSVDFIKADDMASPYHKEEISALHQAILKSGRAMVLAFHLVRRLSRNWNICAQASRCGVLKTMFGIPGIL